MLKRRLYWETFTSCWMKTPLISVVTSHWRWQKVSQKDTVMIQDCGLLAVSVFFLCFDFHALLWGGGEELFPSWSHMLLFPLQCVFKSLFHVHPHQFVVWAFPVMYSESSPASPRVPVVSCLVCFWILILCGGLICTLSFLLALWLFCYFVTFSLFTSSWS